MQSLHALIEFPFARQALLAGVAVGTVCSMLSVIVVLRRMAFVGEGLAHAGFGGVGTAVFLGLGGAAAVSGSGAGGSLSGWAQDLIVLLFCLATAVAVGLLSRRRHVEPDSAIGIVLVAAMAWGALLTDLRRAWAGQDWYVRLFGLPTTPPSAEAVLFGSLLSVGPREVWVSVVVAIAVLAVMLAFFKEIVFYAFDEQAGRVSGVPVTLIHYLLLCLLAVAIVVSVRLAGIVLVSALLILPGATATMLCRRLGGVFVLAWMVGVLGTAGGLLLSLEVGAVSSGPCIVLVLCGLFGAAFAARARG